MSSLPTARITTTARTTRPTARIPGKIRLPQAAEEKKAEIKEMEAIEKGLPAAEEEKAADQEKTGFSATTTLLATAAEQALQALKIVERRRKQVQEAATAAADRALQRKASICFGATAALGLGVIAGVPIGVLVNPIAGGVVGGLGGVAGVYIARKAMNASS